MKPAVARACIVANYQEARDVLDFELWYEQFVEAKVSANSHYLVDLRRRCTERGLKHVEERKWGESYHLLQFTADSLVEESSSVKLPLLPMGDIYHT